MIKTQHKLLRYCYYNPKQHYERLLCECLNQCLELTQEHGNFEYIDLQSNKEPDTKAGQYGIDFKLLISQMQGKGQSISSIKKKEISPGVVITQNGKATSEILFLINACHGITEENINGLTDRRMQKEIEKLFELLEVDKHILLFAPEIRYTVDDIIPAEEQFKIVHQYIEEALSGVLEYRHKVHSDLDCYVAYIVETHDKERYVVICKYEEMQIRIIDKVNWKCLKTVELIDSGKL